MSALRLRFIILPVAASIGTACTANRPHPPLVGFGEAFAAAVKTVTSGQDETTQTLVRDAVERFKSRCLGTRTEAIVAHMENQPTTLRGYLRLSSGWSQVNPCELDARLLETGLMSKLTTDDDGLIRRERVFLLTRATEAEVLILEPAQEEFDMSASDVSTVLYGCLGDGGWRVVLSRGFRLKNKKNLELERLVFGSPTQ